MVGKTNPAFFSLWYYGVNTELLVHPDSPSLLFMVNEERFILAWGTIFKKRAV